LKRRSRIKSFYNKLYLFFGPQHWWPGETAFEVIVGAILTQNTSWQNVEKAIGNLKRRKVLSAQRLYKVPEKELAALIRPAGYFNLKARRLREFLNFFNKAFQGQIKKISAQDLPGLRQRLLEVCGIGPETADSILLYALGKPIFVVDAYTRRIFLRHRLIKAGASYEDVQNLFMRNLKHDAKLFNEYHALLVRLGKEFCLKSKPRCKECPIKIRGRPGA